MGHCLPFGAGNDLMLYKKFRLDKASQHFYVKFTVRAAPLNGSEPDTYVSIMNADRTSTYVGQYCHTTPNDFNPYVFNLDLDMGSILPEQTTIALCFSTTGAGPEPWAPCVCDIIVSTDPIP